MLRWLKEAALVRIEPAAVRADPAPARADPALPPWHDAVAAADSALDAAASRTSSVRFVVSDHYVRYLALPWDTGLRSDTERVAYLRHHFQLVYGPRADAWSFAFDREADSAMRVVAAMDRALLDALAAAAAGAGLALAAIEPLAVAGFNRLRGALPAPDCFFVVAENDRTTCVHVAQGAPRRVASQRPAGDPRRELARLLAAEAIESGISRDAAFAVAEAEWKAGAPAPAYTRQSDLQALLAESMTEGAAA